MRHGGLRAVPLLAGAGAREKEGLGVVPKKNQQKKIKNELVTKTYKR